MDLPSPSGALVDRQRHPEAFAYISKLGGDLESMAVYRTRGVFFRDIIDRFPDLFDGEGIAPRLRALASNAIDPDAWMPTTYVVLALTLVRDLVHDSDDAFLRWNYERQLGIYQRPLFRALMFLFSPTLLFMGAARRWKTFHSGGELVTRGDKHSAELRLTYPPGLYSRVFRVSLVASFRAALAASRAEHQNVELVQDTEGLAVYHVSWS